MQNYLSKYSDYTFFWKGPFSQWNVSPFVIDGISYETAEHYMMWFKAKTFGDDKIADQILVTSHPRDVQALGRKVANFDLRIWSAVAKDGVFRGNMAKFTQNPLHLYSLMETYGTLLVEASPVDVIWGIGMAAEDPLVQDPKNWRGTNWLGEVLTDVRDCISLAYRWNEQPEEIQATEHAEVSLIGKE